MTTSAVFILAFKKLQAFLQPRNCENYIWSYISFMTYLYLEPEFRLHRVILWSMEDLKFFVHSCHAWLSVWNIYSCHSSRKGNWIMRIPPCTTDPLIWRSVNEKLKSIKVGKSAPLSLKHLFWTVITNKTLNIWLYVAGDLSLYIKPGISRDLNVKFFLVSPALVEIDLDILQAVDITLIQSDIFPQILVGTRFFVGHLAINQGTKVAMASKIEVQMY